MKHKLLINLFRYVQCPNNLPIYFPLDKKLLYQMYLYTESTTVFQIAKSFKFHFTILRFILEDFKKLFLLVFNTSILSTLSYFY